MDEGTTERIVLRSMPNGTGWKVTRNDKLVSHYPNQELAEQADARLGRMESRKGSRAVAIMHKGDGSVKDQRSYSKVHAPWLGVRR